MTVGDIILVTCIETGEQEKRRIISGGMGFNPNYRPKPVHRELREFTVKGQKIMAYSKKDAVTKLRHQKK